MRKLQFLIFIFIVFLINSVNAIQLGVSPPNLEFNGDVDEEICNSIIVYTKGYNGYLILDDRWKDGEKDKDINQYNLSRASLGLDINYLKRFKVSNGNSKKNLEVCITAKRSGVFYGSMILRGENSYAGVANWIVVKINGGSEENKNEVGSLETITGSVIGSYKPSQKYITIFLFIFVLLIVLIWLIKNRFKF